jgi:hypothetical protein
MTDDDFRLLEVRRTQALVAREMAEIERLHAPQYELVTPAGRVFSRERYLAVIAAQPFYAAWEIGPLQVRVSPAMAALRYRAKITFPSGKAFDLWHTDIYECQGGDWLAVWSQATQITVSEAGG